jgi:hypothetical protein
VEEYVAQQELEAGECDTWRDGLPSLLSSIAAVEVTASVGMSAVGARSSVRDSLGAETPDVTSLRAAAHHSRGKPAPSLKNSDTKDPRPNPCIHSRQRYQQTDDVAALPHRCGNTSTRTLTLISPNPKPTGVGTPGRRDGRDARVAGAAVVLVIAAAAAAGAAAAV